MIAECLQKLQIIAMHQPPLNTAMGIGLLRRAFDLPSAGATRTACLVTVRSLSLGTLLPGIGAGASGRCCYLFDIF